LQVEKGDSMKASITLILLIILFPSFAYSGEIYGCIKKENKFIREGVKIEITPESKTKPYSANTDGYGTYRLYVPETGKCTLRMTYKEQPVYFININGEKEQDFLVYSYEGSVQYNFSIEEKDGQYFLRRK